MWLCEAAQPTLPHAFLLKPAFGPSAISCQALQVVRSLHGFPVLHQGCFEILSHWIPTVAEPGSAGTDLLPR